MIKIKNKVKLCFALGFGALTIGAITPAIVSCSSGSKDQAASATIDVSSWGQLVNGSVSVGHVLLSAGGNTKTFNNIKSLTIKTTSGQTINLTGDKSVQIDVVGGGTLERS